MSHITDKPRPITPHAILNEKLKMLKKHLAQGADDVALDMVQQCLELSDPLDDYLVNHTTTPSQNLQSLEKKSNELDWDSAFAKAETALPLEREMLSGAVEGQFLKMLIGISRAKNVLEIGSFTGYASLAMAEALPADGQLIACEYDEFTADFSRGELNRSVHGDKIEIRTGNALETMKKLADENQRFDLIFIDADKKGYASYYNFIMDHGLLNENGLICIDNTLFMGQAYSESNRNQNGQAIADFNKMLATDDRIERVLLPLRDGVTMIRLRDNHE